MVYVCCVPNCPNNGLTKHVILRQFPRSSWVELRQQWLDAIKRVDLKTKNLKNHRICDEHFTEDSFCPKGSNRLKKALKCDAVPTLKLPDKMVYSKTVQQAVPTPNLSNANHTENREYIMKRDEIEHNNLVISFDHAYERVPLTSVRKRRFRTTNTLLRVLKVSQKKYLTPRELLLYNMIEEQNRTINSLKRENNKLKKKLINSNKLLTQLHELQPTNLLKEKPEEETILF
uniref:Putative thap domain protein n=1 Tax=Xenopsylla cheopis TaxID=163159 RepID=A0A6M2DFX4_XENCH